MSGLQQPLLVLEQACQKLQTASSNEERNNAEQVLLQYRALGFESEVLWFSLEHSKNPQAQFETARALCTSFIREMQLMNADASTVQSRLQKLGSALWTLLLGRSDLVPFVVKEYVRCLVVAMKHAWVLFDEQTRMQSIKVLCLDVLEGRLKDRCDPLRIFRCVTCISTLVREFSLVTNDFRIPMEQHISLHLFFQESGLLLQLFQFSCCLLFQEIQLVEQQRPMLEAIMTTMLEALTWSFKLGSREVERLSTIGDCPLNDRIRSKFRPSEQWIGPLFGQGLVGRFFALLHALLRLDNPGGEWVTARVLVTQMLHRLAAVDSSVCLAREADSMKYLVEFICQINATLPMILICRNSCTKDVALHVVQVVNQLFYSFGFGTIQAMPQLEAFLQNLGQFTVNCMTQEARDADEDQEHWANATLEELLTCWMTIYLKLEKRAFVQDCAFKIYSCYVETRLLKAKQECEREEDLYEDKEQLMDILHGASYLARLDITKAIAFLMEKIQSTFQRIQRHAATREASCAALFDVVVCHEEMHWLVQVAGNLIADAADGEVPLVPESVDHASEHAKTDEEDPVMALVNLIMSIMEWQNSLMAANAKDELLSPFLRRTFTWFVKRWSQSYLFFEADGNGSAVASSRLKRAYGSLEGGRGALQFILRCAIADLQLWGDNSEVAGETSQLLLVLSTIRSVQTQIHLCEAWPRLVQLFLGQQDQLVSSFLFNTSTSAARLFTRSVVQFGRGKMAFDRGPATAYYEALLGPTAAVLQQPDFIAKSQSPEAFGLVSHFLTIYRGIAEAQGGEVVYQFLEGQMGNIIRLVPVYRTRHELVTSVLHFYLSLVTVYFDIANENQQKTICDAVSTEYGRHCEQFLNNTLEKDAEAQGAKHVRLLLMLIARFSEQIKFLPPFALEVILLGLNVILPRMSLDMLQFPKLCSWYFNVVRSLFEVPETAVSLPVGVFRKVLESIKIGLSYSDKNANFKSFSALLQLSKFNLEGLLVKGTPALAQQDAAASPGCISYDILRSLLELLVTAGVNSECLDLASDCLLALIAAYAAEFQQICQVLIERQAVRGKDLAARLTQYLLGLSQGVDFTPANALLKQNVKQFRGNTRQFLVLVRNLAPAAAV